MVEHKLDSFTEAQRAVLGRLATEPADKYELADRLGVAPNTAKGHIERLRDAGVEIEYVHTGKSGYYSLEDNDLRSKVSTGPSAATRRWNSWRDDHEAVVQKYLREHEPRDIDAQHTTGGEDMVALVGDLHFGDLETRDGPEPGVDEEVYHMNMVVGVVEEITRQVLAAKHDREAAGYTVDRLVVPYLGDMITGEGIFDGQAWGLEADLNSQLAQAVQALRDQLLTFCEAFPSVHATGVVGNHGENRTQGASKANNADLTLYGWLFDSLEQRGVENLEIGYVDESLGRNVTLRPHGAEWTLHLMHGHTTNQVHVDATARSESDWRGIRDKYGFDAAARGHHHSARKDTVLNAYDVWTNPSPKPGGDFAEKIGKPDCSEQQNLATVFTANDHEIGAYEHVITDAYLEYEREEIGDGTLRLQPIRAGEA